MFLLQKTSPFIGSDAVEEELRMGSRENLVMLQVLDDNGRTDPDGAEAVYCNGKVRDIMAFKAVWCSPVFTAMIQFFFLDQRKSGV